MLFITSDIKVLATLINVDGEKTVISLGLQKEDSLKRKWRDKFLNL